MHANEGIFSLSCAVILSFLVTVLFIDLYFILKFIYKYCPWPITLHIALQHVLMGLDNQHHLTITTKHKKFKLFTHVQIGNFPKLDHIASASYSTSLTIV